MDDLVLFIEAIVKNSQATKRVLNEFCKIMGEKNSANLNFISPQDLLKKKIPC